MSPRINRKSIGYPFCHLKRRLPWALCVCVSVCLREREAWPGRDNTGWDGCGHHTREAACASSPDGLPNITYTHRMGRAWGMQNSERLAASFVAGRPRTNTRRATQICVHQECKRFHNEDKTKNMVELWKKILILIILVNIEITV